MPRATYRLQFNKDFTFKNAVSIVPYLSKLGISHVYSSPILKAKPGSMHGYDTVDHSQINPELGTLQDFNDLVSALRKHGMGIILDIVPNHMGIGKENPWWQDVLENGSRSPYAEYFDIDWQPIKKEIQNKVLLPILGNSYGQVLKDAQLTLLFTAESGKFALCYFDHVLPINPATYHLILNRGLETLELSAEINKNDKEEYLSILSGFKALSYLSQTSTAEYLREQRVQTRRLVDLCIRNKKLKTLIEECLENFAIEKNGAEAEKNLHALLEEQSYRLSFWRVASDEINYRRFFDVDSLAAVRTEDKRVFDAMHELIFNLVANKKIDGLRIDHPDGLYDPAAYFEDLQRNAFRAKTGQSLDSISDLKGEYAPIYIVAEKILAPFEHLPKSWNIHGTTGYDYLNALLRLLVDCEQSANFDQVYKDFTSKDHNLDCIKLESKDLVLSSLLASELNVLAHKLDQIAESNWYYRDFTLGSLRNALKQVVKFFPVYRTYINDGPLEKESRNYIDWAISAAKKAGSPINARVYDFIHDIITADIFQNENSQAGTTGIKDSFVQSIKEFTLKLQQFTGPVMAKSVEDTAFYRYNRFVCLNEVGGEPDKFGSTVSAFHLQNQQRQINRPYEMLSTSTHDTKRSEDIRARLAVISEIPEIWRNAVMSWKKTNEQHKIVLEEESRPNPNDEYFLYQNLIGVLPADWQESENTSDKLGPLSERLKDYAIKAIRESKNYTSWVDQNENYELSVIAFVEKILNPVLNKSFINELSSFHKLINDFGLLNSLVQAVLKLTSPGIPDIYQGCEIWNFCLVDPDNRRSIDYIKSNSVLSQIEKNFQNIEIVDIEKRKYFLNNLLAERTSGAVKLFITKACLELRAKYPDLFTKGTYTAMEIDGPAKEHVVAFARKWDDKICYVIAPIKMAKFVQTNKNVPLADVSIFGEMVDEKLWNNTKILLPDGFGAENYTHVFSGRRIDLKEKYLLCSQVFKDFPIAVTIS